MPSVRALRETLGNEATYALETFVEDAGRHWREDVLTIAGERFERRLAEEIGTFRIDMAKEFAAMRVELLKWSFLFWIGQFAAVSGMMAFLLKTLIH